MSASSVDEEPRRVGVGRERADAPHLFDGKREGLSARREDRHAGGRMQDVGRQTSGGERHVLAAVEDEQRGARLEVLEDRGTIVSFSAGHSEGVGHRGSDQPSVGRLRQVGDPDSVGPLDGDAQSELDRETGLAHAGSLSTEVGSRPTARIASYADTDVGATPRDF